MYQIPDPRRVLLELEAVYRSGLLSLFALALCHGVLAEGTEGTARTWTPLVGHTRLRTDLPGGRHANIRTSRAWLVRADGTELRPVFATKRGDENTWTQFGGWSPDGTEAIVYEGWQSPENARWEETNRRFRMEEGRWRLDALLVDLDTGRVRNLTAVERASHYNGGVFFHPDGKSLGFTPLIAGVSRPWRMDRDGRNKRPISSDGSEAGFAYGYSASPDGRHLSYHENYQIWITDPTGANRRQIRTGHPFNFAPRWSPDSEWLLFSSGVRGDSHPHVVRNDGSGLRKLVDLGGYPGWILHLDVPDFHEGSSDLPEWSVDGHSVFYTAKREKNVELFEVNLDGVAERLTHTAPGTLHYHPSPSPDGCSLAFGSKRDGVRQLFVLDLEDRRETRLTSLRTGHAAMWPHWQPRPPDHTVGASHRTRSVLRAETGTELAPHGEGNVYAPEIHRDGSTWKMWYGGQGRDGHDRIHLAESDDGRNWSRRDVVLDCGAANHVNDPSVVRVDGTWWMFFTIARTAEDDEIAAATSKNGRTWEQLGVVLRAGPAGSWNSRKVGRPSVLFEGGKFRLWYDGQPTEHAAAASKLAGAVAREGRAIGYAESYDGRIWTRREQPVFRTGAGAVHVTRLGSDLLMLIEAHRGVRWASSPDGLSWRDRGRWLELGGGKLDRFGHVTPFLLLDSDDAKRATIFFGAASRRSWDGNSIASVRVELPERSR